MQANEQATVKTSFQMKSEPNVSAAQTRPAGTYHQ
jgi:hypothetical protein